MRGKSVKNKNAGRTDWQRVASLTEDEIEKMAQDDADNPASNEEDWADAIAFVPPRKTVINARFDTDVVTWFKAQGPGYQPRMNAVLRHYMDAQSRSVKR
jgi:uncharacterized protein (DUF4415 family)